MYFRFQKMDKFWAPKKLHSLNWSPEWKHQLWLWSCKTTCKQTLNKYSCKIPRLSFPLSETIFSLQVRSHSSVTSVRKSLQGRQLWESTRSLCTRNWSPTSVPTVELRSKPILLWLITRRGFTCKSNPISKQNSLFGYIIWHCRLQKGNSFELFQLRVLWQRVLFKERLRGTLQNSHRGEALPVPIVWKVFQPCLPPEETHGRCASQSPGSRRCFGEQ